MSELDTLNRRIRREVQARKAAERILEEKALELHYKNVELQKLNQELEVVVERRTQELQESQKAYKSLVETAGDVIYNLDKNGCFSYVNPVAEKILDISIDNILGKHFSELVHPDYRYRIVQHYADMVNSQRTFDYLEFPGIQSKEKILWLGQRVDITYTKNGELDKVTAIARDITEIRDVQERIRKSEEKYRGLIENMELGLMEVDVDGKITRAYDWFCDMLGYEESELLGKDPMEMFIRDEDVAFMRLQESQRYSGNTGVYELEMQKKDGSWIWVLISGAPILDEHGETVGSMGVHYDITKRKNLESQLRKARDEAERARQAEKEFLAQMSHEIRTPLNAVIGMANLLSTTELSEEQSSYVQDIKYAADVLHGLISDVLDLSKIEAGQMELAESLVNVHQSIAMLSRALEYRAKEKGNTLSFYVDNQVPQLLLADRNIINQVLLNLVGNSIKFTKDAGIHISLRSELESDEICILHFKVRDEGIGIAKDKLGTVFEKFKQAEGSKTHKEYGGTGLGLPICKQLIELHGGEISVDSDLGEGTTFTFSMRTTLPANADIQTEKELNEAQAKGVKNLAEISFLVAEDTFMNQKYIQGLLNKWKSKWKLAKNGKEAVEMSLNEKFDIILMDMQMPEMNGYQAAEAIRRSSENPNYKTPIVALTASALVDEKKKAISAGMNDHLTKPFTPDQLQTTVMKLSGLSEEGDGSGPLTVLEDVEVPEGLDKEYLVDFYDGDAEYAHHMSGAFLKNVDKEIATAKEMSSSQDAKQMAGWLHSISPMLSMVGAIDLADEARAFENSLKKEGWSDSVEEWTKGLPLDIEKTADAVRNLNKSLEKLIQ